MLNNIVHRQELDNALAQTKIWVDTVENALSVLNPEEYILLDRFYIHPERKAADRLAGDLHADVKTIYRWKDDAILKFTKALYGVPET